MQKVIRLRYRWIRQRRKDVLDFLEENYWLEKGTNSKTTIENGLGITGDDAAELIEKFSMQFHVDMSSMDFNKHFYSEGELNNHLPIFLVQVLIKLLILPFALFELLYSFKNFKEMMRFDLENENESRTKKDLTIGDLITSTFTHKFTLQKDVRIALI
ncbi:hypothetical protein [Ferruginibacter sp.]